MRTTDAKEAERFFLELADEHERHDRSSVYHTTYMDSSDTNEAVSLNATRRSVYWDRRYGLGVLCPDALWTKRKNTAPANYMKKAAVGLC